MRLLERAQLLTALNEQLAATRRGSGRLVMVAGEAGIGKTALVDAFLTGLPRGTGVLRGGCDPVVPARPFAPLGDMADRADGSLRRALGLADRDQVFERFLVMLRRLGSGSVVVFEDLHWADSATLDLIRIVGRRLQDTPVLLIGTYRSNEVDEDHPLRRALGDIPAAVRYELDVPALSEAAVGILTAGTALDAGSLYRATGGNAFFVTEAIASGGHASDGHASGGHASGGHASGGHALPDLPSTVRDAVLARLSRLSDAAQRVLRVTAVLGVRADPVLVTAVAAEPGASFGIRECLARGMLEIDGPDLRFRHELARLAVHDSMPPSTRAELHRRALDALRSGVAPADNVRLARHAIEAGDMEAIAMLAPAAAEQAARLGAHGEAAEYLAIALALPASDEARRRAELLERYAYECSVSSRVAAARSAQEEALAIWRRLGDRLREGNGLRAMSMYMWHAGEGDLARQVGSSAIDILECIEPRGRELAQAYAKLGQLTLNSAQDDATATRLAKQALDLAEHIGDEPLAVHALTTLALAKTYVDNVGELPAGWGELEVALERARAANLSEDVARILINLIETARDIRRYDLTQRYVGEATAFLRDRQFDLYLHILGSRVAQLDLNRGNWDAAETEATRLLEESTRTSQTQARALGVLAQLHARRGEPGVWDLLDEAMRVAGPGELQEICPIYAIRAEAAWLEDDVPRAGMEAMTGLELAIPTGASLWYSELSFWAWRTGKIKRMSPGTFQPYLLDAAGRHREAAEAWAAVGFPYEQALALSDTDEESAVREALVIFHSLGARVMAGRVAQRLRDLGARQIPRGPRPSTRANPAGLSARELEVLALLSAGERNADIASRLVLSQKTVDHHVSAILRKLGVTDRAAARRRAHQLGLQDGGPAHPT